MPEHTTRERLRNLLRRRVAQRDATGVDTSGQPEGDFRFFDDQEPSHLVRILMEEEGISRERAEQLARQARNNEPGQVGGGRSMRRLSGR